MANKYSLHAIYFCTGCGIIEVPPVITARWDAERFGVIPVATPRQANLFLITGYVSVKTLRAIIELTNRCTNLNTQLASVLAL